MQLNGQNTKTSPLKSTEELKSTLDEVIKNARAQGATDVSVSVNHDCGFSVDVRMGEIETIAFSEDNALVLTVYIGNKKGSASSTDTAPASLKAMVKAALEIAEVSAEDPCFGLAETELMVTESKDLDLYHPWDITPEQAIAIAKACEDEALSLDTRIVNSDGVNFSTYVSHVSYANTHGARASLHSSRHSISCSLVSKAKDCMQRDYDYTTAIHPDDLMNVSSLAKSAVERTVSRLHARQIKTQKTPVIFSSRVSSGIFGSLMNAISGSNLYKKNSFLLDALGQVIFPSFIQVHEQPYLLRALGSTPMDGEGVATRNNIFVDAGRLNQYVLGSYSARKLGLKTTANSDGVHNLTIDPTTGDLPQLLKMMGTGLLVTELMGQGVNIITGDYSRGASGFWVENGIIQYPVEGITIASNLKDMFKGIVAVGNDINPAISTRCGSILIDEMMVAGE
jgi:PmbA protein